MECKKAFDGRKPPCHDPALTEAWQRKEYPKIARRENALIFFADESGIRSDHHTGTSWAPVGKTPIVKVTSARCAS